MSSIDAISVIDIDRSDLVCRGADVFRELERGTIFYVHNTDEVQILRDHIVSVLSARISPDWVQEVRRFFNDGHQISRGALRELLICLREIRDTRYLSCLFSDLIGGFGLPAPTLIDTGFFRCVFTRHVEALLRDPRVPPDIYNGPPPGPEGFLQGFAGTGNPHRDLDSPHYTFQVNFWFPLHRLEEGNSLLLFPDVYTANVPYQVIPQNPRDPSTWGYGRPVCRAMEPGDVILFHSQHFHASPTQAPDSDRLTAELRVASACLDDNGSIYRRQFWNAQSFKPLSQAVLADAATRAARISPSAADFDAPLTAQELLASMMSSTEAVRITGNLWTRDTVFSATRKLEPAQAENFVARLIESPFSEDRQLFCARYLIFHGYVELAERVLDDILQRTDSYYFALEVGRIAGAAQSWTVAGQALIRAIALGQSSPVRLGRYRGDIPARPMPPLQLLPDDAVRIAGILAAALQEYLVETGAPPPLLDHRIFYPFFVVAQPVKPFGAVVGTWSLAIFVPADRMRDTGLHYVTVDGEERVEVNFKPEALVRNPTGVIVGHSADELLLLLRERLSVNALPNVNA
jgi:hypothetical protein